ncbi:MAG: protein-glutamine gamma-glutamyltransferase TgpA [Gammaproteobacteria bacterium]
MLASLAWTFLPHLSLLPDWISILVVGVGLLRLAIYRRGLALPPRWLLVLMVVGGSAAIFVQFGTLLGRDAGVSLLSLMLALKLLEMRTRRDTLLLVFLGYFLVITNLLYSQHLLLAIYLAIAVWLLTATLLELAHPDTPFRRTLRYAALMLLQAVPVMLVLFVLFPRIPGPLWGLPKDAYSASTGLSDRMEPGSISQLSRSDAVAFRVKFDDPLPPPQLRYWRGPVFWYTDGRRWTPKPEDVSGPNEPLRYRASGRPVHYTVTLEPHRQRWLFALDLPAAVQSAQRVTRDFQALSAKPVRELVRYRATSYTNYQATQLTAREARDATQLPASVSPRVRALAARWVRQASQPVDVVEEALRYFRTQPFVYTLNPPLLGGDPIDQFLFETRKGFCEHYAAAFTILMRAAGIPTRVVTGYQGGELNPLGDYLIVRQSDAHAWAEVYLPDRGWVRIDPTAAVAPERIERGIDNTLSRIGEPMQFQIPSGEWLWGIVNQLRYLWDGMQNGWNQWVLGYGPELQQQLLDWVGLARSSWRGLVVLLAGTLVALTAWLAWGLLRSQRAAPDPLARYYQRFCKKLASRGYTRQAHEGPLDFAKRVSRDMPEQAAKIHLITRLYIAMRYGNKPPEFWLPKLKSQIEEFRP